ncbi:sigma-54-dependent transcriptional regulator [Burkholderiaceae bacterium UC74_6]
MSPSAPLPRILVLDDDPDVGTAARMALRRRFGAVGLIEDPAELTHQLDGQRPDVLLLDMNFAPGRTSGDEGLELLCQVLAQPGAPAVVVMTAYAEIDLAVKAVKLGAFDFITKPWDNERLVATLEAAAVSRVPREDRGEDSPLLGTSKAMVDLRRVIATVAPTEAHVLILGETGVGKALVAQALHAASRRADEPFLALDLGALSDNLFDSEIQGFRRGGTLFLDEIGKLGLNAQTRLLSALERRQASELRVLSATALDEVALFDPQRFRADLLQRLNTIVLRVPPLRERREDIGLLARHFLAAYAAQYGKGGRELSGAAQAALQVHDWPGNVRALRQACERAVILATGPRFEPGDFALQANHAQTARIAPLAERERAALEEALRRAQGNISETARLLGLSRAALYRRLDKHGL